MCLGAVPGLIWLLCLRQKWVLPFLGGAFGALAVPLCDVLSLSNTSRGFLSAGGLILGLVVGLLLWLYFRRRAKQSL